MFRKGLLAASALVLAIGPLAQAEAVGPAQSPSATVAIDFSHAAVHPILADDNSAPAPLMSALDVTPVGNVMNDLHLTLGGYIEAGYLYDLTNPHNQNPPRSAPADNIYFPGVYKNEFILDQIDLALERKIDPSKGMFDVGFRIEALYGRDAFFTHSNGILDEHNKHGGGPDDQFDLLQGYVDFALPVTGLSVEVGKFVTLLGVEYVDPTQNAFYTHSYLFSYAIPFTQTGILGTYALTPSISLTAGATRGWNQSSDDSNGSIDFLGELNWTVSTELKLTANLSVGPQTLKDNGHYWTVPEFIASYQLSDQLLLTADLLYGDAASYSQWYGAAGYAAYTLNKFATLNLRGEFYHDGRGFTTGFGGTDINYEEISLGCAITPLPDTRYVDTIRIRPEIRADFADQTVFDNTHASELTAAVGVY